MRILPALAVELAQKDMLGLKPLYDKGSGTPYVAVFIGNVGYSGIAALANSPGSDGTVRWAGCALNTRMVRLDFRRQPLLTNAAGQLTRLDITDWVTGRLATVRMAGLILAQFAGGVLAGACLRYSFEDGVLAAAHFGTPHLNDLAYGSVRPLGLVTGTLIELLLTFFLVLVILSALRDGPRTAAWAGGIVGQCGVAGGGSSSGYFADSFDD